MKSRPYFLVLLLCASIAAAAYAMWGSSDRIDQSRSQQFAKEFERIRAAEKIDDKLKRCLAYPDPSEFRWDPEVVRALCALNAHEAISLKEINNALEAGHPEVIDTAFRSYLDRTYQAGEHGFLNWVYTQLFGEESAETTRIAQRWVELDPNSGFALVARGTQFVASAWAARGEELLRDTPGENKLRMLNFAERARVDFNAALEKAPRLISAYHGLIRAAQLSGDHEFVAKSAQSALELDPADQRIYDAWFSAVEPQWDGSNQLMLAVVTIASRHENENPLLKRSAGRLPCVVSISVRADNDRDALALYRRAAADAPVQCFLEYAPDAVERIGGDDEAVVRYNSQAYRFLGGNNRIFRRSLALQRLGRTEWALEGVDAVLNRDPTDKEALLYRGWILKNNHDAARAEKAFARVLEIDPLNREATTELVVLYTGFLNQPAKAQELVDRLMAANEPRAWLLTTVLHGHGDEALCRDALRKYLDLVNVNADDVYEQRDIDRAKQRLVELDRKLTVPPHK